MSSRDAQRGKHVCNIANRARGKKKSCNVKKYMIEMLQNNLGKSCRYDKKKTLRLHVTANAQPDKRMATSQVGMRRGASGQYSAWSPSQEEDFGTCRHSTRPA